MEQQPPKKTLLTPERTMEVADSLSKKSNEKKVFYGVQKNIAEKAMKKGDGDTPMGTVWEGVGVGIPKKIPSAKERLGMANEGLKSASKDSANAARYRSLAVKAVLNKMKK